MLGARVAFGRRPELMRRLWWPTTKNARQGFLMGDGFAVLDLPSW
jgi:hypothetical protein